MNDVSWADALQGVGAILAVIVTVVGYILVWSQIVQTNKSLQHSSNVAIYSISSEFYKFLAENSYLRPYFYYNKECGNDDIFKEELLSVCEYLADFFEFVLIESRSLDKRIFESWKDYMVDIYANSPIFRYYISNHQKNYTNELIEVFS